MSENRSLSTIVHETARIEEMLIESGGELTPDIEHLLSVRDVQLPEKVDKYAAIIERFDLIEKYYRAKADQLLSIARASVAVSERCKENLKLAMKELNVTDLDGNDCRFKLSSSKPALVISDEDQVPREYWVTETITKIDKNKVKEDLALGVPVAGAKLQESYSLRKYAQKASK